MKKTIIKIFIVFIIIIMMLGVINIVSATENDKLQTVSNGEPKVLYNTHIQNIGWEGKFSKSNGAVSGTTGKSLRLEAINIKLENISNVSVKYQTHISDIGWQDWKKDGQMSGTEGQSRRLEAIRINLETTDEYSVMYRVHVENEGWQNWKIDGELAGTTGKSLRLEAIEIKIVKKQARGLIHIDTPENNSTIYGNKTVKVSGWKMTNKKDTTIKAYVDDKEIPSSNIKYLERPDVIKAITDYGTIYENAKPGFEFNIDTTNLSNGKHSIKILVYSKNNEKIQGFLRDIIVDRNPHIKYSTHIEDIGWQNTRQDGNISGTTGQNKRVEAIKIEGVNLPDGAKLKYRTYIEEICWQNEWKNSGEIAGTTGQGKRIEAIKIKLEGTEKYSVMYRAHVQNIGWQEWCYDGESAGTFDKYLRIEAIEIKIVPKVNLNKTLVCVDEPAENQLSKKGIIKGWMMTSQKDVTLKMYIDNSEIDIKSLKRTKRTDVSNAYKGYGDEDVQDSKPGFEMEFDYSKYSEGNHTFVVKAISKNGETLYTRTKQFNIRKEIPHSTGTYGRTGLKVKGDGRGQDLKYYKYGEGPNVFFATFAIHGYEDLWNKDGQELVNIANDFYQRLINSNDYDLSKKWTIYIFPGVNQDGLTQGYTNNGPGRTTLYSKAPNNKGIDLNRCWQIGSSYTRYTDDRNYNGTAGFQAYEAEYLRDFLLSHKSTNGQTVLVDLHGWTQQLIGDSQICSYYERQFPENDKSAVGRYGTGYLVNWARSSLGTNGRTAKSALIELPNQGVVNHNSVVSKNFSNRYIDATLSMLRSI